MINAERGWLMFNAEPMVFSSVRQWLQQVPNLKSLSKQTNPCEWRVEISSGVLSSGSGIIGVLLGI